MTTERGPFIVLSADSLRKPLAESPVAKDDRALLYTIGDMKPTQYAARADAEAAITRTVEGYWGRVFKWSVEQFAVLSLAEREAEEDARATKVAKARAVSKAQKAQRGGK